MLGMPDMSEIDFDSKIERWRESLLDLTKRNRLINCPLGGRGALELKHPSPDYVWSTLVLDGGSLTLAYRRDLLVDEDDEEAGRDEGDILLDSEVGRIDEDAPDAFERCLRSPELREDHGLVDLPDKKLGNKLYRASVAARTSLTEAGVHSLYAAFGMLRWYEAPESDRALLSPLLLVPVDIKRASADEPWTVSVYEDDVVPNFTLAQLLATQFNLQLPELSQDTFLEDHREYLQQITELVEHKRRWRVEDRVAIHPFSFQKIAMWQDLGQNRAKISNHSICRAVAGDDDVDLRGTEDALPSPGELDDMVKPSEVHQILDCDSTQLSAILAVKAGANLVMDGPPGTGKSQTIANMITEALADGKTVLFVSEKAAALEVVKRRLDGRKLGDFCLECHSHKSNKKAVVRELERTLHLEPERYQDQSGKLTRLFTLRRTLNAYVRALHKQRSALGISAYRAHGRLSALQPETESRIHLSDVLSVTQEELVAIEAAYTALKARARVFEERRTHPWRGCQISSYSLTAEADLRFHLEELLGAVNDLGPALADLRTLKLVPENVAPEKLPSCLRSAEIAAKYPLVPASWTENGPTETARAIQRLHALSTKRRELQPSLEDYREDAPQGYATISAQASHEAPAWAQRIVETAGETVRQRSERVERVRELIDGLNEGLGAAVRTGKQLANALCMEPCGSLRQLKRLNEIGQRVAPLGPARPSWFEGERREALKAVVGACLEHEASIQRLVEELGQVGVGQPHDPAAAETAASGERFVSFWRRLFGWGKFKRERLASLYQGEVPPTKEVLSHLESIRVLHNHSQALDEARAQHGSDLPPQARQPWERLRQELESIDALAGVTKLGAEQVRALCSPGEVDREQVSELGQRLERRVGAVEGAAKDLRMQLDYEPIGEDETSLEFSELSAVEPWLTNSREELEAYAGQLDAWLGLLKPGADPVVKRLPRDAKSLGLARQLEVELEALREDLPEEQELPSPVWAKDWSQASKLAEWLEQYYDRHNGVVQPALIALLTDPNRRECLANALKALAEPHRRWVEEWEFLAKVLPLGEDCSTGIVLREATFPKLASWISARLGDVTRLQEWIDFQGAADRLRELGLEAQLDEILSGRVPLAEADQAFLKRFYRQWLDAVYETDTELSRFRLEDHEQVIRQFRKLDRDSISGGFKRIRSRLLANPDRPHIDIDAPASSEVGTLLREVNKKRRHLPLRQLFAEIPTLLTRLKPCIMMSPLAVSTYFASDRITFDLVIFDEASQVRPHDAIGAIYRGRQLVVAGDQKQLPPTSFFEAAVADTDEAEEEDRLSDYESILDVCCTKGIPRKPLCWHYRSRRESLIAFSNHHFYGGKLITFPSVFDTQGNSAVRLDYVEQGRWHKGTNPVEAQRVAELVFEHFKSRPELSLGVVAFSQKQQFAIDNELLKLQRQRPELQEFFDEEREDPFFVKNLENVQGDERNVIMISMGYGFDVAGKFGMRFGPLNRQGGERRLNVLVTRATHEVRLVASVRSHDIDLTRTNSRGVALLRAYLEYAERGVEALGTELLDEGTEEHDSPFEAQVAEALRQRGLIVRPQVGCSGFRIDLALVDPDHRGRYVLGVECDGATYHSSSTARDRDRLRQEVLEDLGWKIVRIWSTDWVRDPERQIRKVLKAYERALTEPLRESASGRLIRFEPDDEQPELGSQTLRRAGLEQHDYSKIDDVPELLLRNQLLDAPQRFGGISSDELVKVVARSLGFARTGSKIRARVETALSALLAQGRLREDPSNGKVVLGVTSSPVRGRKP